jgi:RecJ-like exonuclease
MCEHPWAVCDAQGPYCQACGIPWAQVEKEEAVIYANPHKSDLSANAHKDEVECPMCRGQGHKDGRDCKLCNGTGAVSEQVAVEWPDDH